MNSRPSRSIEYSQERQESKLSPDPWVPEDNDTATVENVAHTAMLLFASYIDAATSLSESCRGGGGSAPESSWGKKDDEDERAYARRCLQMAHSMYKSKSVKRGFHR